MSALTLVILSDYKTDEAHAPKNRDACIHFGKHYSIIGAMPDLYQCRGTGIKLLHSNAPPKKSIATSSIFISQAWGTLGTEMEDHAAS